MTNTELKLDILDQLDFEPSIDAAQIGITVDGGIITLTGKVRSYADKMAAIRIVENVRGVRAIADEIEVRPQESEATSDDVIAKRIADLLTWNTSIPEGQVHVTVSNGRVTLRGEVEWRFQVDRAAEVIGGLRGVTGINNHIHVKPSIRASDVSDRIRKALLRDAELDASAIHVVVEDGTVTLEGHVRYLSERKCAERAAWSMPGVRNVVDRLSVR